MSPATRSSTTESFIGIQQEIACLAAAPLVRSAMEWFRDKETEFARWQFDLAGIPAPPFGEGARSDWLAGKFQAIGLKDVHQDSIGNVFGSRPGEQGSSVSISARSEEHTSEL